MGKKKENIKIEKKQRIKHLKYLIEEKEKEGGEAFFQDIEIDPPSRSIAPDEVDYLREKFSSKVKTFIANRFENQLYRNVKKTNQLRLVGLENLEGIEGGAILTGNHFHFFESGNAIAITRSFKKKRKLFKVVKEGNVYIKGFFGFLLRNTNTLPLSSNMKTMIKLNKAIEKILSNGDFILIYPEQAMWWNYRKPRPHRTGPAFYASKNNVPIISYFVTMEDLETLDDNGEPNQRYTCHILPPLYPDKNKSIKENEEEMTKINYDRWVEIYEKTYGKKLEYLYEKEG